MQKRLIVNLCDSAIYLYDCGYRSSDRDRLITEYELTDQEADIICEKLASLEHRT